jgi:hypothetical protein
LAQVSAKQAVVLVARLVPYFVGYQPYRLLVAATLSKEIIDHTSVPCSKELWDLLANRGGSRGPKQKRKFIQEGLSGGQLQDKRPYILDYNCLNQYKFRLNNRVASELLQDLSAAAPAPSSTAEASAPSSSAAAVAPSSSSKKGTKRPKEPEHPPSEKAFGKKPPEPPYPPQGEAATQSDEIFIRFTPKFSSQQCYKLGQGQLPVRQGSVVLRNLQRKDQVRLAVLDWHQVVERGRAGTTWELESVQAAWIFSQIYIAKLKGVVRSCVWVSCRILTQTILVNAL